MKKNVLIIDDQPTNRKLLIHILKDTYDCVEAANGKEALAFFKENARPISAVITDLRMPVMDGLELTRTLRLDPHTRDLPILATTVMDYSEAEESALNAGVNDILAKPYKPGVIRKRLANLITLRENAATISSIKSDTLTHVFTREYFYTLITSTLFENPNITYDIFFLDIEHFDLVNGMFGDQTGDEILQLTADVFSKAIGSMGFCARIQGDQFAALTVRHHDQLKSICHTISDAINTFDIPYQLNIRFGVYPVTDRTIEPRHMCDLAKMAAKSIQDQYGKIYAFYDESFHQKMVDEQLITNNMEASLSREEFIIYYQPKMDMAQRKIIGAEALVRWQHPKLGFIAPGRFIPTFEKNGFITELDRYIWRHVCADIRRWLDKGWQVPPISVNVSRIDLFSPDLGDYLLKILADNALPIEQLHLEITESFFVSNVDFVIDQVQHLKDQGFIIEMDDFGSGYSSLNFLSDMPVDIIKLDMMFLCRPAHQGATESIINFVIQLSQWMDMAVIAEGVETEEQVQMLLDFGCRYGQGYYYAKPMPRQKFETLFIQNLKTQTPDIPENSLVDNNLKYTMPFPMDSIPYVEIEHYLANAPFGLSIQTKDPGTGKIKMLYVNRTLCKELGFSPDVFKKLSKSDLINLTHPKDRPHVLDNIGQAEQEQRPWKVNIRVKSEDHKWVWFRAQGQPAQNNRIYITLRRLTNASTISCGVSTRQAAGDNSSREPNP